MRERRLRRALSGLGIALLLAAAVLTVHNVREDRQAGRAAAVAVAELRAAMAQRMAAPAPVPVRPLPEAETPEETSFPSGESEAPATLGIDGRSYAGILAIPALGLELPVLDAWSESGLKCAPCLYSGAAATGDMVIAGHSYKTHFGTLGSAAVGDQVVFTAADGTVFTYSVESAEVLSPWQVREMTAGDWALTLFTCTPTGQARLAVRCAAAD